VKGGSLYNDELIIIDEKSGEDAIVDVDGKNRRQAGRQEMVGLGEPLSIIARGSGSLAPIPTFFLDSLAVRHVTAHCSDYSEGSSLHQPMYPYTACSVYILKQGDSYLT